MLGGAYVAQAQNMDFGFDLAVRTTGHPRRMEQSCAAPHASMLTKH